MGLLLLPVVMLSSSLVGMFEGCIFDEYGMMANTVYFKIS